MELVKEAPVFYPSQEEFENPMQYIEKIRPCAEAAGICKIVPPGKWRAPFAVDTETFKFRTRVQNVCKVDGIARVEREFLLDVRKYLFQRGVPMGDTPIPLVPAANTDEDGKVEQLRFYRLFATVRNLGGGIKIILEDRWSEVVNALFPQISSVEKIESLTGTLRDTYTRYLLPYEIEFFPTSSLTWRSKSADLQSASRSHQFLHLDEPSFDTDIDTLLEMAVDGFSEGLLSGVVGTSAIEAAASAYQEGCREAVLAEEPSFSFADGKNLTQDQTSQESQPQQEKPRSGWRGGPRKKRRGRYSRVEAAATNELDKRSALRKKWPRLSTRLGAPPPPPVFVGAVFYKYYQDLDACFLGKVIECDEENDAFTVEFSQNNGISHSEVVSKEELIMLLASGETKELARDALVEGICQECMRADNGDRLLLCDGCNFAYHTSCLNPPIRGIPQGDWFCSVCLSPEVDEDEEGEEGETDPGDEVVVPEDSPTVFKSHSGMSIDGDELNELKNHLPERILKSLATFGYGDGDQYTIETYRQMAEKFRDRYFQKALAGENKNIQEATKLRGTEAGDAALEREYWRLLSEAARTDMELVDLKVSYGSDLDTGLLGSGFPSEREILAIRAELFTLKEKLEAAQFTQQSGTKRRSAGGGLTAASKDAVRYEELRQRLVEFKKYAKDGWNLNIFPKLNGSLLQYVDEDITGVIVPWLYMGMLFSSFCWHTEDHYFASINYHHWGEPKTWYGVPSSGALKFEEAARKLTPELFLARRDILTGIVTQYNPTELAQLDVPVYHIIQRPGDIVLTFPQAYHGGFNHGVNCAEAVNFATQRWIPYGEDCVVRYAELKKNPVISHDALLLSLAMYSIAHPTDASSLSQQIFERVELLKSEEIKLRRKCLKSIPRLEAVAYEDAIKVEDNLDPNTGVRKSRMGGAYGRERSHMSRMGRMAPNGTRPGDSGWLVQAQCKDCKTFCSLSFVHVIWPEREGKNATQQFFCLEHSLARLNKECIPSELTEDGAVLELVVVWSDERLEKQVRELGKSALGLLGWRYFVWKTLGGEKLLKKKGRVAVREPTTRMLKYMNTTGTAVPYEPGDDGSPPGALFTLDSYLQSGKESISLSVVEEIISQARSFSIDPNDKELLLFQDLLKLFEQKFSDVRGLLQRRKGSVSAWPTLDECEVLLKKHSAEADIELNHANSTLKKIAYLKVPDHPLIQKLTELTERARLWAKKTGAILKDIEDCSLDGFADALERANMELRKDICITPQPTFDSLNELLGAYNWMSEAKKIMAKPMATLEEAAKHIKLYDNFGRFSADIRVTFEEMQMHFQLSEEWIEKVKPDGGGDEKGEEAISSSLAEYTTLKFKPVKIFHQLQRQGSSISVWGAKANVLLAQLRSARETNDETSRVQEQELEEVFSEGVALGFTKSTNKALGELGKYREEIMQWRSSMEKNLLNIETLTFAPKGSFQFRQVPRDRLLVETLRSAFHHIEMRSAYWTPSDESRAILMKEEHSQGGVSSTSATPPILPAPGPTLQKAPEIDLDGNRLACACRTVLRRGAVVVSCMVCKEKYHPHCLAVTFDQLRGGLETYVCPTCVYDGKLKGIDRSDTAICYCQQPVSPRSTKVQCIDCHNSFHPWCVGLAADDEPADFRCPTCCEISGINPMVNLFCICRKPEFGTSEFNQKMFSCDNCKDWFHPVCVGLSEDIVDNMSSKYFCVRCCDKNDVPYVLETGQSGFLAAKANYCEKYQRAMERTKFQIRGTKDVASLKPNASLEEVEKVCLSLEGYPVSVAEEQFVYDILSSCRKWTDTVADADIRKSSTRSLWEALYQQTTFPLLPPLSLLIRIQEELWMRYLQHSWFSAADGLERHPTITLPGFSTENVPTHMSELTISALRGSLQIPEFRSLLEGEIKQGGVRGSLADAFLRYDSKISVGSRSKDAVL